MIPKTSKDQLALTATLHKAIMALARPLTISLLDSLGGPEVRHSVRLSFGTGLLLKLSLVTARSNRVSNILY